MAISKDIKSVIVCVLVLGLILEQVHVEGKSCCKTTTNRNCYNLCRLRSSRKTCSNACGCKIVSGRTCPRDYPKFNLPAESADEPDAIQYCNLGCMASVCDAINNDVFTVEGTKIDMERCSDECDRFCSSSARMASVVAE